MGVPIINSVEEFKEVYKGSSVVMDTIFGELLICLSTISDSVEREGR
jgi:hypothetical protein